MLTVKYRILEEDITVAVLAFLPGSTRAEVEISIPDFYGVTQREISQTIKDLVNGGNIGGAPITAVQGKRSVFRLVKYR